MFVCEENGGEFVKTIEGGFKNGVLQYIRLVSNHNRRAAFCKHELADQCNRFVFGERDNEFPAAMFGESMG
jgi:hypothetical protein